MEAVVGVAATEGVEGEGEEEGAEGEGEALDEGPTLLTACGLVLAAIG